MGFTDFFSRKRQKESAAPPPFDPACGTCPLTSLPVGQPACLVCVHAGQRLNRRLAELGLTPGVEMRVLQNNGGPLLISVRDSRLALGRGTAAKVGVTPLTGPVWQ